MGLFESLVNHHENVALFAGIVLLEALEVLVGLKLIALLAIYVAEKDESSGEPVLMGRVGVDKSLDFGAGFLLGSVVEVILGEIVGRFYP